MGLQTVNWYSEAKVWQAILVLTRIWKGSGMSAVIFLASITSIDSGMYEAAAIDGDGRIQMITKITLPLIMPTIIIMTMLSVGKVMFGDFRMIYALVGDNGALHPELTLRKDIMKKYGIDKVPETFEELTEAFEKVMKEWEGTQKPYLPLIGQTSGFAINQMTYSTWLFHVYEKVFYVNQDNYDLFVYGREGIDWNKKEPHNRESIVIPSIDRTLYEVYDWQVGNLKYTIPASYFVM